MPTYRKRGNGTEVQIRKKGHAPISKTFSKKSDADAWATGLERSIDLGSNIDHRELRDTLVRDLLVKYRDEVCPTRKGCKWETNRINAYLRELWSHLSLTQDVAKALTQWVDRRVGEVKPQSVNRDLNLIGSVFTYARKKWHVRVSNPVADVMRPKAIGGERDIVWTDDEIKELLGDWDPTVAPVSGLDFVPWVVVLLRSTGLRLGSLASTRMDQIHLDEPMIDYDANQVKNDEPFRCPINRESVRLLRILADHRSGHQMLFGQDALNLGKYYRDVRDACEAAHPERRKKLRLHDLRHTWTTELMLSGRVRSQIELMKITGRSDLKSLAIYFNASAKTLSQMLD